MHAYLHCLSHSPLVGYVDPAQAVLDEVNGVIASARARIAAFEPELVAVCPDHYNGIFLRRDAAVLFRRWSYGDRRFW